MNVLVVTPLYPPHGHGGGEVVVKAIVRGLIKKGHKITVISGYYPEKKVSERPQRNCVKGVQIIWIPLMRIMEMNYPQMRASMPPSLSSLIFLKTINYNKYDVIHFNGFGHLLIDFINFVSKNPRKILTIHGFPKYVEQNGGASYPLKLLYKVYCGTLGKKTLNSAKAITVVSKFVAEECIKRGIPESKINVISNGIELEKYKQVFSYDTLKERFKIQDDDTLILSIARITWNKGLEYALEAIHNVMRRTEKSIKYVIVGPKEDQIYYSKLKKIIERLELNNNVIFTGFIPPFSSLKLQLLTRANIFLAPSLHETFGLVVLEAMSVGKPIIASNCEGLLCLLDHMKTGILVEPGKSAEIVNGIMTLLEYPDLCIRLSKNSYNEAKKYDWNAIIGRYEELYLG